jgi:hypothetical protein
MYLIIIIMLIVIIFLLWWEYIDHDCIPGKTCRHSVPAPTSTDSNPAFLDKLLEMVRANYTYVSWRQALLAGLIGAIPVVYFLKQRMPTLFEWIVVGGFIFIVTYYSYSWIWAHFYYPNSRQIERNLILMRDRLAKSRDSPVSHDAESPDYTPMGPWESTQPPLVTPPSDPETPTSPPRPPLFPRNRLKNLWD